VQPPAAPAWPALVPVAVARAGAGTQRTVGVIVELPDLVPPQRGVVLALADLVDAAEIFAGAGTGGAGPPALRLDRVLAVAPQLELALLGAPAGALGAAAALPIAPATREAALYQGRDDVVLRSIDRPDQTTSVDSSARRTGAGAYWYALEEGAASTLIPPAALLDDRGRLIGLAVPPPLLLLAPAGDEAGPQGNDAKRPVAYDAQALLALWESWQTRPSEPLGDFVQDFFARHDTGRLLAAAHYASAGEWERVLAAGGDLANAGWPVADVARPLLEEAYQVRIARLMSTVQGAAAAARLLDEAALALGWTPARRLLAARLARARNDVAGAVAQLNAAWDDAASSDTRASLQRATRELVADVLASGALAPAEEIDLLRSQLERDPRHAPFHAALGQRLFDLGRYREALTPLYQARGLDGARYGRELDTLIARAEERMYAPDLTVVPVYSQGSTLYVSASIPGLSGQYRFILDTGASITAISPRLLGVLPAPRPRGSVRLSTANGQVDAPLVTISSLDVAGARVRDLDVVVLDSLEGYDGLLGLSFLDHFNMELDRNRSEMTLRLR
jgi:clan AA aspartic protease (TIGR02281 family)